MGFTRRPRRKHPGPIGPRPRERSLDICSAAEIRLHRRGIDPEMRAGISKNKFAGVPDFLRGERGQVSLILVTDAPIAMASSGLREPPQRIHGDQAVVLMPSLRKTCGFMGMVQFEVRNASCALPGTSSYGSLSMGERPRAGKRFSKIGLEQEILRRAQRG